MGVICSQGLSLLSVDLSGSDVTDTGLNILKSCTNLQELSFNFCDRISEHGLRHICGLSNLTSLSFKRSNAITAQGMSAFTGLVNLIKLDLERCSGIHGGLVHLKGLTLESLNIMCCNCITDEDMQPLSGGAFGGKRGMRHLSVAILTMYIVIILYSKNIPIHFMFPLRLIRFLVPVFKGMKTSVTACLTMEFTKSQVSKEIDSFLTTWVSG
ncbi:Leucine-rich repeat [Macleaya cordata]|uniref:Leucine-rich repeat n=1 Tax=Macleaya cordata TaxID=56857 RepID=A0A200Q0F4_MACCD|nr:Leucine-rich repeat [Macleaya cordata]